MEKYHRKPHTLKDKMDIIEKLKRGCKNVHICREYKLSSSTVSTIWANRENYLDKKYMNMKMKRIRKPERADVDEGFIEWYSSKRQTIKISTMILQNKTNELDKISKTICNQPSTSRGDFMSSKGWIDRFKTRYNIHLGKIHGEGASVNMEIINKWKEDIWPTLHRRYNDCDIFNGDETALFYKLTPDKTLKFKGEKCVEGKFSKERLTILVCANMDGSEKSKLCVIGKPKSPRCFKHVQNLPVNYFNNSKAWMTSEIFKKFFLFGVVI